MALDATDWQLTKENLMDRILTIFRSSQWSDCTFQVGQSNVQVFKAHRLILASCSPVFEAMLFGPLAETQCIRVLDIEPDVFASILEYIYTDKIKLICWHSAAKVLYAAQKYMIKSLTQFCKDYIVTILRPNNVLSVLEFAEDIQEKTLLEKCMLVICKHTQEVLKKPHSHIPAPTLKALLDQDSLNMGEAELFNICLDWAKTECQRLELECSTETIRDILMKTGVLSKIRFLCMSAEEFKLGPMHSGLLEAEEINFFTTAMQKVHNPCDEKCNSGFVDVPNGWSGSVRPRKRIAFDQFYCVRRFLKTAVTVTGQVRLLSNVQADCSIIVSGVRIFTRLMPASGNDNLVSPQKYKENIEISVLDPEGSIIGQTHFSEVVEYNTLATVVLREPVRLGSNREYGFLFVLPTGEDLSFEYPVGFMAQTEYTRGIKFRFCDHADLGDSGVFVHRLDMGYVDAVLYSL